MTSTHTPSPGRCLGTTAQGHPCRARPQRGGDYCFAHRLQTGARAGNHHPHPSPPERETLDNLVDDMLARLSTLAAMLDRAEGTDRFLAQMNVYGRCVMHFAALLRVQHALGESGDDILEVLGQVAGELAEEHGWAALRPS